VLKFCQRKLPADNQSDNNMQAKNAFPPCNSAFQPHYVHHWPRNPCCNQWGIKL